MYENNQAEWKWTDTEQIGISYFQAYDQENAR